MVPPDGRRTGQRREGQEYGTGELWLVRVASAISHHYAYDHLHEFARVACAPRGWSTQHASGKGASTSRKKGQAAKSFKSGAPVKPPTSVMDFEKDWRRKCKEPSARRRQARAAARRACPLV